MLFTGPRPARRAGAVHRPCHAGGVREARPDPLHAGVFQHYVAKDYELRITVIGERIFAGRINSQKHAESSVDWRHRPFDMEPEPHALPAEIGESILAFLHAFGLVYGAFDFVVMPDGRYVFLEINPGGQYMWVESVTGMPITEALADALCAPCM